MSAQDDYKIGPLRRHAAGNGRGPHLMTSDQTGLWASKFDIPDNIDFLEGGRLWTTELRPGPPVH